MPSRESAGATVPPELAERTARPTVRPLYSFELR